MNWNSIFHKSLRRHERRQLITLMSAVIAIAAFFAVQASLSRYSEALSSEPRCGMEEHVHTDDCYDEEGNLICTLPEHVHTEECYQDEVQIEEPALMEEANNPEKDSDEPKQGIIETIKDALVHRLEENYDNTTEDTDDDVTVTAEFNDGVLPEDVVMKVTAVDASQYEWLASQVTDTANRELLTYDISFYKGDELVEPDGDVKITFKAGFIQEKTDPQIVHFEENEWNTVEKTEVIEETEVKDGEISVITDSFSVYGIIYTVDFTYEVDGNTYYYSIEGNSSISLKELLRRLNVVDEEEIDDFASKINNVWFSDESLVQISRQDNGDWMLESLAPFTSKEQLVISMNDGQSFLVKVTDEQLTDITSMVSGVTIEGATLNSEGQYVVKPGKDYIVKLIFAESPEKQFNDEILTYKLPIGVLIDEIQNYTFNTTVTKDGVDYVISGNTYSVASDGTLTINWNKQDPNYGKLLDSNNMQITVLVRSQFDSSVTSLNFGNNTTVDFSVDTTANVTVNKTGNYDPYTKKVYYTLEITSTGVNNNVSVEDVLSGTALNLDQDSISVTLQNGQPRTYTEISKNQNGFKLDLGTMSDGEKVRVNYSASVDFDVLSSGDGEVTFDKTNNTVKTYKDNTETDSSSKDFTNSIDYSPVTKAAAIPSIDITEGDKTYREIEWTIHVNDPRNVSLAGKTIKDNNLSPDVMKYAGEGIQILVTKEDGTTENRTVSWNDLNKSDNGWTYSVPDTDGKASYLITYKTRVETTDMLLDTKITNKVETPYDEETVTNTVKPLPENKLTINKSGKVIENNQSEWKIEVNVPAKGYTSLEVTDLFPLGLQDVTNGYYFLDTYVTGSLTVTGLESDEGYTIESITRDINTRHDDNTVSSENKEIGKKLVFHYQKDGNQQNGLKATENARTITIKLKTDHSAWKDGTLPEWLYQNYINTAEAAVGEIKAEDFEHLNLKDRVFTKTLSPYVETYTDEQGNNLPVYHFQIVLSGLSGDTLVLEDKFNTSVWEYYKKPLDWDDHNSFIHGADDNNNTWERETAIEVTPQPIDGGILFNTPLPKNGNGNNYAYYAIDYYVRVKSQDALNDLYDLTAQEGGEHIETNTAKYDNATATADVTYEYDRVDKEIIKEAVAKNGDVPADLVATYRIVVNEKKARLNGGQIIKLTDTLTNLSMDYSSIHFETDPEIWASQMIYDMSGQTLTVDIPDETKVIITYSAKVVPDGTSTTYKNKVTFDSMSEERVNTVDISAEAEAHGDEKSLRLFKYESGNMGHGLGGAVFKLYEAKVENKGTDYIPDLNEFQPVKNSSEQDVTFTTGSDGYVTIEGSQSNDGWSIWTNAYRRYYLEEVTPPMGYQLDTTKYFFEISPTNTSSFTNGRYIYVDGDTLKVRNYPSDSKLVIRKVLGGDASFLTEADLAFLKENLKFVVSGKFLNVATNEQKTKEITIPYRDFTDNVFEISSITDKGTNYNVIAGETYIVTETITEELPGFSRTTTWLVNSTENGYGTTASVPVKTEEGKTTGTGSVSFENHYDETVVDLEVEKVWSGDESDTSKRKPVTVHLMKDGNVMDSSYDRILTEDGNWKGSWENLDAGHEYSVSENTVAGYSGTVSVDKTVRPIKITVTNTPITVDDEKINIFVEKKWFENDVDKTTDASYKDMTATVSLYRNKRIKNWVTLHIFKFYNDTVTSIGEVKVRANSLDDVSIDWAGCGIQSKGNSVKYSSTLYEHTYDIYDYQNAENVVLNSINETEGTETITINAGDEDLYLYILDNNNYLSYSNLIVSEGSIPENTSFVYDETFEPLQKILAYPSFSDQFLNLEKEGSDVINKYEYSYSISEDPISGFTTEYKVDNGKFKDSEFSDQMESIGTHNAVVKNNRIEIPSYELPETGGIGIRWIRAIGILLLMTGGCLLIKKIRSEVMKQ